jgi:hypothetical protein
MEELEVLKQIEANTKSSAKSNKETANWAMFKGIVLILELIAGAGGIIYLTK